MRRSQRTLVNGYALRKVVAALFSVLLLAHGAFCQTSKPQSDGRIEIPFRIVEGVIWLDVSINGSQPLNFVLDTASGDDVIDRVRAEELKLPLIELGERANAGTGDGTTRVALTDNVEFTVGSLHYKRLRVSVVPFDGINRSYGERFDGVLGFGFLSQRVVTIDYVHQKLILHPNDTFTYAGSGHSVPLKVVSGTPMVTAKIVLGEKDVDGAFLIDAPFRRSVAFTTPFTQKNGLLAEARNNGRRVLPGELVGVAGKSKNWTGRITALQLGGFTIPQPIADFSETTAGSMGRPDIAGIIGAEVLKHFIVTLDYTGNRLILEPGDEPKPSETDMAGIVWDAEPPDYQTFRVTQVQDDSPASEAGVQVGDVLVSLDGRPASELRKWKVTEALKRPGAQVQMVLNRDGNNIRVKVTLRRMV
jgi:hypothetical protein